MCTVQISSSTEPVKSRFRYVGNDEPHVSRRKEILKKYPEILQLYGPDIRLFYACLLLITLQLSLSFATSYFLDYSSKLFWFLAWSMGGTITHSLSLANHELSHNLAFQKKWKNELLCMIVNCAQAIPTGITFKRYHMEHHIYQGDEVLDTDLPCELEVIIFEALGGPTSVVLKTLWVFLQPAFYALRPIMIRPKDTTKMEVYNAAMVSAFNLGVAALFPTFGMKAVIFNAASTLLGMGLHPVAGHFIAEHYTFEDGQETYSYYGPLNYITFNVGYHNEHHDFPKISGFHLPKVKEIAPEFYDERYRNPNDDKPMKSYTSWTKVIWDYITQPTIGPHSRIKRITKLTKK